MNWPRVLHESLLLMLKWTLTLSWEPSAYSLPLPFDSHSGQSPKEASEETMSNGLQAYMLQPQRPTTIQS